MFGAGYFGPGFYGDGFFDSTGSSSSSPAGGYFGRGWYGGGHYGPGYYGSGDAVSGGGSYPSGTGFFFDAEFFDGGFYGMVQQSPVVPQLVITHPAGRSAKRSTRRERYIARYKGDDYTFRTEAELEEFVNDARKSERPTYKKPKPSKPGLRVKIEPEYKLEPEQRIVLPPVKIDTRRIEEVAKIISHFEALKARDLAAQQEEEEALALLL